MTFIIYFKRRGFKVVFKILYQKWNIAERNPKNIIIMIRKKMLKMKIINNLIKKRDIENLCW